MRSISIDDIDLNRLSEIATWLTARLPSQLTVGLVGTLGAGKTTLTQKLAEAAGVNPEDVTSPTFTLLCSYDAHIATGPIRLHHLDAYRIADEDEFLELGVDELFEEPDSWTLIEWADRVESVMPVETLWIHLQSPAGTDDATLRTMTFSCANEQIIDSLGAVKQSVEKSRDESP